MADTHAADTIDELRRRIEAAENNNDAGVFADIVADDVVVMVPDFPTSVGKAAAVAFVAGISEWMRENLDRRVAYSSDEVHIVDGLAFDRGTFSFSAAFKDGSDPAAVTGKYLWVYRRDASSAWKLWRWIVARDENETADE